MILTIDIGNTNIVVGCIDDEKTYFIERLSTVKTKTELEYAVDIKTVLEIYKIDRKQIRGGIISSVVPQITNIMREAAEKIIRRPVKVVGPGLKTGLNILMDNPAQLGSDLVADAVAGLEEYPVPLIIFDMGDSYYRLCYRQQKMLYRRDDPSRGDGVLKRAGSQCGPAAGNRPGTSQKDHRKKYGGLYEERDHSRECRLHRRADPAY